MFRLRATDENILASSLLDQNNFYKTFLQDLRKAKREVIVECPFITTKRLNNLMPTLRHLKKRNVKIVVNTKPVDEHEPGYAAQAEVGIARLMELGAVVLCTGGHHRKLAIIDRTVLYEGSLNILSQNDSCEIMRRIYSEQMANQMLAFLHLDKFIS